MNLQHIVWNLFLAGVGLVLVVFIVAVTFGILKGIISAFKKEDGNE